MHRRRISETLLVLVIAASACSDADSPPDGDGGAGGDATNSSSSATAGGGFGGDGASGGGGATAGGGGEGGQGEGGKIEPIECDGYPLELTFPAEAETTARAELATLSAGANMTWSAQHGTLSLITNFAVQLDCASNGNQVWDAAWALMESHPDLFQLDQSEWYEGVDFPCSAVTDSSLVNTSRQTFAGRDVAKDVLAIGVAPDGNGGVLLNTVSGFYLPVVEDDVLQDCPEFSDDDLESIARSSDTFDYVTFNQCVATGSGTYTPQPNDTIELDSTFWEWQDAGSGVTAHKLRRGRLFIHPDNWTPELTQSNVNCPDESGDERVYGFVLLFDPVTGEMYTPMPGIGCIVC